MKLRVLKKVFPFLAILFAIYFIDYFGVIVNIGELDYGRYFQYKYVLQNIHNGDLYEQGNINYINITNNVKACDIHHTYLLLVVKSKIDNIFARTVIRRTWGQYYNFGNISVTSVFSLGVGYNSDLMAKIHDESEKFNDIVQADFIDAYYNNTLKTVMGLRWAAQHCKTAKFIMFVDDDYYVSIKNLLKFVNCACHNHLNNDMFAGYVIQSAPHRHKLSKWYMSLTEYPYNLWPPYVTAGAFILSRNALLKLYNSILTTPIFRFDDVFLSLNAMRSGIHLTHCKLFHFARPPYNGPGTYKEVIASHGFDDSIYMEQIWRECWQKGYA